MPKRKIRDLREDNDLTQVQLAQVLHVTQSTYSKYERGNVNIPNEVLIALAVYYHVSADYLLGIDREQPSKYKR